VSKSVGQLVEDLAGGETLLADFKTAIQAGKGRDWLAEHDYEFKSGVIAVLKSLTWAEVKAMVHARNEMEENDVDNMVRLQMV
jgi:hypothetical protein